MSSGGGTVLYYISLLTSPQLTLPYLCAALPQVNSKTHLSTHAKHCFVGGPIHSWLSGSLECSCYLMEMTIIPEGTMHYLISC